MFAVTRAAQPLLRAQKSGVIINITLVWGRTAFPMNAPCHATKFGLDVFFGSLWYELAPFGIRVKVMVPGGLATGFSAMIQQSFGV